MELIDIDAGVSPVQSTAPLLTTLHSTEQPFSPTLLIVDDDANFRMLLRLALRQEKYEIYEAANGEEALTLISTIKPAIILLDICMPGMDGIALLRTIRKKQNDAIVFMTTGLTSKDWVQTAFESGADGFFPKPFDLKELHRAIRAI